MQKSKRPQGVNDPEESTRSPLPTPRPSRRRLVLPSFPTRGSRHLRASCFTNLAGLDSTCHTKVQYYQPRWSTTRRQPHSEGQQAHVPDCHRDCRQGRGAGEDGEINEYCQGQVYGKGLLTEVNDTRCKVRFVFLCIFEKLPRCPSTL